MTDTQPSPIARKPHLVATLVSLALLAVAVLLFPVYAPWILPIWIVEGPMVQLASETGADIVWYTSRAADCTLTVTVDNETRTVPVETNGRRCRARVADLAPHRRYPYKIRLGDRVLAQHSLYTNKAAGTSFRFLVLGDSGRGKREQYVLAGVMAEQEPDFILHTGDLVYPEGARKRYAARFFAPYRRMLGQICYWPCIGNHDIEDDGSAPAYVEVFDLPANGPPDARAEHDYWFDYAGARIAVIDSNVSEDQLETSTAPWLREVMSASSATWKFVSFHHPPYTGGKYKPDQRVQRTLVPVCEEVGVDAVFCGHDHNYQRIKPMLDGATAESGTGVSYIVTGAGGARLYRPREDTPQPDYLSEIYFDKHSFTRVDIDGRVLRLAQINVDGEIVDEWEFEKTASDAPLEDDGEG